MYNLISHELPKKIRSLRKETSTYFSHRLEGMIDSYDFYEPAKDAAIIIDVHSEEAFLKKAIDDTLKCLASLQLSRGAAYTVLLWTEQGIVPFLEKTRVLELNTMLPRTFPDKGQTTSSGLGEMTNLLPKANFIVVISDGRFRLEAPTGSIAIFQKLKARMIWVFDDFGSRETLTKCTKSGFISLKNIVGLNLQERIANQNTETYEE